MNSNRSHSEPPETPEQHNLFHWRLIKPDKKKEKHTKIEPPGWKRTIPSFGTR